MSKDTLDIQIRSFFDDKGFRKVSKNAKRIVSEIKQIGDYSVSINKSFNKQGKQIGQTLKGITKKTARFKGEYLSTMFGFMVINRALTTALKSLMNNFKELTKGGTNPLSQSLTRLQANFKFLEFMMIDAASPLIAKLADSLAWLFLTIAKSDPFTLKEIVIALGTLATLTGLGVIGSQMKLLSEGIKFIFAKDAISGVNVKNLKNFKTAIKGLAGVGFAVDFTLREARLLNNDGGTILDNLIGVGEATIAGALIGSIIPGIGTAIGAVVGFSIGVVATLANVMVKNDISSKDFLKAVKESIFEPFRTNNTFVNIAGKMPFIGFSVRTAVNLIKDKSLTTQTDELNKGLEPTLTNLESASILSNTSAEDISKLGTTINTKLTPALSGKDGLNKPLGIAKDTMSELNTNINDNITYLGQSLIPLKNDTDARNENAESISAQASANFDLARSIREVNEARAERDDAAREGVAGG